MTITMRTNPRSRVAFRLFTGAITAAALAALTACGSSAPAPSTQPPRSAVDVSLQRRLPASIRGAGVLTIGTDASYAPASFFAPDGRTIVGFEPDLAAELGRLLGIRVKMTNIDFSKALTLVPAHRVDAVMSAMTDTGDRQRQVDFVDYFSAGTAILVQRGNPAGVSDLTGLCGQVVAVEKGTIQVDMLQRTQASCGKQPISIQTFATNSDALVRLRTGRAVAVLTDYPPAVWTTTDPRTRGYFQLASTAQYEPGPYGIAVAKDNQELRDVLAAAMTTLVQNGTYTDVLKRWSVADGALPSVTVNGGAPS